MRNFTLFLLMSLTTFFISCGGDGDCVAEDWIGTYTGTSTCDDGTTEDVTIVIEAGSSADRVIIDDLELTISGCTAEIPEVTESVFGIEVTVSGEYKLDGNQLTGTATSSSSFLGIAETIECSLEASR